jgi:hypothetical protein
VFAGGQAFDAGRADLSEVAMWTVGVMLDTHVVGERLEHLLELTAAGFGHSAFEEGAKGLIILSGIREVQAGENPTDRGIDGDGVSCEGLLDDGREDVVGPEGLELLEGLDGLLLRLFQEGVEGEAVGPLEDLTEKSTDALGAGGRIGELEEDGLDLGDGADADLIPVEELGLQTREHGLRAIESRALVADPEDDSLQHGRAIGSRLDLVALAEQVVDVVQEVGLAGCGHIGFLCAGEG